MIRLDRIGKNYRTAPGPGRRAGITQAVRSVTAAIEPGTITGIVGPNGAGKSTLFGLLLGFLEPTDGAITIAGVSPRAYVRRHGASYLPERFQLPRDWTVATTLRAFLSLDAAATALDELLGRFELERFAGARAHTLSRGTMQRVGLAQAFARPRRLVVLDEPTEGLDPIWRVRFRELIRQARAPDRAILIASHDLMEIERLADSALVLHDGALTETVALGVQASREHDYILVLATPHDSVDQIFPGARAIADAIFAVTVADAGDLNTRLAALLAAGALIVSVNPAGLEERIVRSSSEAP